MGLAFLLSPLLLAQALASSPISPLTAPVPADSEVIAGELGGQIDRWVSRMVPLGFSGGVLLSRDGEVLLARAYGDADRTTGQPAGIDTLWPIGSISKHFTAAAVLQLQSQGKLSVSDRLDALLPSELFEGVPRPMGAITVHQLLTHTAGFPESSGFSSQRATAAEQLRHAFRTGLDFAPGTESGYSNIGYGVLAAVVEVVSGKPFEQYLRNEVFVPAGMTDTGIRSVAWDDARVARGMIDGQDEGRVDGEWTGAPWGLLGAGGVQTTLWDMHRWSQGLRNHSVLDGETFAAMTTPHMREGPGMSTGYGCVVFDTPRNTTMIGHNGSNDVFAADWRHYLQDGVTVFVTSNHADVYADVVSAAVTRMAFGMSVPLPPQVSPLPAQDLARYDGDWLLDDGGTITVQSRGSGLLVSSVDAAGARLVHPLPSWQRETREQLLKLLGAGWQQALERDFASLHGLIDAYAPQREFEEQHQTMLDDWSAELGAIEHISTLPGRNRFGEIAVIVQLAHERGEIMLEYSFGQDGVGAIRFLSEVPARLVQPLSPTEFVAYDPETDERWQVKFRLSDDGAPVELMMNGGDHTATRR